MRPEKCNAIDQDTKVFLVAIAVMVTLVPVLHGATAYDRYEYKGECQPQTQLQRLNPFFDGFCKFAKWNLDIE